jgi:hypothetical protein
MLFAGWLWAKDEIGANMVKAQKIITVHFMIFMFFLSSW